MQLKAIFRSGCNHPVHPSCCRGVLQRWPLAFCCLPQFQLQCLDNSNLLTVVQLQLLQLLLLLCGCKQRSCGVYALPFMGHVAGGTANMQLLLLLVLQPLWGSPRTMDVGVDTAPVFTSFGVVWHAQLCCHLAAACCWPTCDVDRG